MAKRPQRDPYGGFPAFLGRVSGNSMPPVPPERRLTRPLWLVRLLWGKAAAERAAEQPPRWSNEPPPKDKRYWGASRDTD